MIRLAKSLSIVGLSIFCLFTVAKVAHSQNVFSISNDYLQVDVNTDNGNMTILTLLGNPDNPLDDNLAITDPEDTALILRIYNVPGAAAGGGGAGGGGGGTGGGGAGGGTGGGGGGTGGGGTGGSLRSRQQALGTVDLDLRDSGTVGPVFYGLSVVERYPNMIRTRWLVYIPDLIGQLPPVENPSLVVERECVIVGDVVEIRVRVVSRENISRDIGIGVILDTGFNPPGNANQDTPGFFMVSNSSTIIDYERAYTKAKGLPDLYFALPLTTSIGWLKGTVNAGEGPLPDKVLFALVPSIQSAAVGYGFDYTPNTFNALGINIDSAVGLYWNRLALPAKGSVEVVTHFGVDVGPGDYRRPMSLRVVQPDPLEVQTGDDPFTPEVEQAYVTPNPFVITAFVYNSLTTNLTNVSVTLGLPEGLSFPPGEPATKTLPFISPGGEQRVSWQVKVDLPTAGVKELVVSAFSPQVGIRQVKVPVVIPTLPLKRQNGNLVLRLDLNAGYNLVGFPFVFINPEPSVALGIPSEELQLATYDPTIRNYLVYRRDLQFNKLELGLGYWLRLPVARSIDLDVQNIRSLSFEEPVVVPIKRGWNLLSNPFPWQVLLRGEEVRVGSDPVTFTFDEAVERGWVRGTIFVWHNDPSIPPYGGEYRAITFGPNVRLEPLQGFWLYSEIDGNIIFDIPAFLGSWQIRGTEELQKPFQPPVDWAVQVVASSAAGKDNTLWLGVSKEAHGEFDRLDLPKVPAPPGSVQVSSILRVGRSQTPLSMDIRPPQSKTVWTLELLNPAGGEVKLQFEGLAKVPRSVALLLCDPETNQQWSLRSTSSVTVTTQPHQPKRLQVVALQTDQLPLRVHGLKVTPLRGRGAHIQFSVTMPARVQVQVRSLTGRVVWETSEQVVGGRLCSVFWNGRSKSDEMLPSGIYTVVVRAITDNGRQSQAQTILRLR